MNEKINIHEANSNLLSRLDYIQNWNVDKQVMKELKVFLQALGSGKVNKGVHVSERTQCKYISLLKSPLIFINKSASETTKEQIEKWDDMISKDKLLSEKKKPYSYNMKVDMRIAYRTFLEHFIGSKANDMTDCFDTREKKKTPDYLKEAEAEKLYKSCKSASERYLIAVLFDSGARAEEFLNIRFEDIHLPEGKENYVQITLKEEYSKTEGRTVSLYWRHSLEAVKDYLAERIKEGIKSKDQVFTQTYDSARFFLSRLSNKILHKNVNFHLFRHSSATFYATKMNRQQLCYRYGWKFSSDMPDVYISRAGMNNKELDEKFEGTELNELKDELEKEKQRRAVESDRIEILEQTLSKLVKAMKN